MTVQLICGCKPHTPDTTYMQTTTLICLVGVEPKVLHSSIYLSNFILKPSRYARINK